VIKFRADFSEPSADYTASCPGRQQSARIVSSFILSASYFPVYLLFPLSFPSNSCRHDEASN